MLRSPARRRRTGLLSAALTTGLALTAGLGLTAPVATAAPPAAEMSAARAVRTDEPGVTANLWEWNWRSIGRECTDVLGPAGYTGVQVAPPQNSVKRTKLGDGSDSVLHPWWEVYQPVSYRLTSRMGSEAQFRTMVRDCRRAGVKVYVDAVINHMTGQGDTSYAGTTFERYRYPGLYDQDDFHKYSGDCPSASGGIEDFNNAQQVFRCELVGLADLRTGTRPVRDQLAAYLNKLIGYGVSGFRVDAGKHIGQTDLDAIYSRLRLTRDGVRPYWALEVFGGGPGVLSPQAFTRSGDVLGLDAGNQIKAAFKSSAPNATGNIGALEVFGAGSGLTPSAKTLSFVQNHDTDRTGDHVQYKDGATNVLANEWLLADGYGSPQVYSSFAWQNRDDSPPANAAGLITDTVCGPQWTCTHRNPGIVAMVRFDRYVGSAAKRNWWDDGANVIAFSRGNRGWAAFNNGNAAKRITVRTGLPAGTYCDTISGRRTGFRCTGTSVTVNAAGRATVTVGAKGAVAFTRADRI